jgi:two-component system, response regulator / RNA-binding antiterminator
MYKRFVPRHTFVGGPNGMSTQNGTRRLRVLIANQRSDHLALLATVIERLGHEVVAEEIDVTDVGAGTARMRPDVALVGLGTDAEHALELISAIVRETFCPVIALIPNYDESWIEEAARRGIFAYIVDARPEEIQSAIDIGLNRFLEFARLQGAFDQQDAALQQQLELLRSNQALLLEVQDGILQQLTTASLCLQVGEIDSALAATGRAIEQAKSIVTQTIDELLIGGSTIDEIMRDSVPRS